MKERKFLIEDISEIMAAGPYVSVKDMLRRTAEYFGDAPALQEICAGQVVSHSFRQVLGDVETLGEGLIAAGLEGRHIAICADNSYRYIISYLAISCGAGVAVPVDKDAPEAHFAELLCKCDAHALICSAHVLKKAEAVWGACPFLQKVILIEGEEEGYECFDEIAAEGLRIAPIGYYSSLEPAPDALAAMFFTSGTTGANKCVMRTQGNLIANIMNCIELMKGETPLVSMLPMNHIAVNNDIVSRLAVGKLSCINGSIKDFMANLQVFRPKMLSAVPMFVEMIRRGIWQGAEKQGKAEQLRQAVQMSNGLLEKGIDRRAEIFREVLAPFGGIEMIGLGGAPVSPDLVRGMHDVGVDLVTGYGVTECGPLISMNFDTMNDPDSIGVVVPHTEVKIDRPDDEGVGEILARGPSVSSGYYKDQDATRKAFTEDGWFRTGDYGRMESGRLYLQGRKKNLIVLSNGKNVSPEELEHMLSVHLPYVREAVVYAADTDVRGRLATLITAAVVTDLPADETLAQKITEDFRRVNDLLPQYKKIHCVQLHSAEFEKNAMRKIIREKVLAKHNAKQGILI